VESELLVFGEPIVLRPRPGIELERTFYSFKRGNTRFEFSGVDLAQSLEAATAKYAGKSWEAEIAAGLRLAVSTGEPIVREIGQLSLGYVANRCSVELFKKGSFRVVEGAESGSDIVLLGWRTHYRPLASRGGNVVCWSGSRTWIVAETIWIS
jgi:hypothetical protein